MPNTSQISNMIAAALSAKLTDDLIEDPQIPEGELAGLVREGRLQDNPEKFRISVLVHPGGDPEDDEWKDISVAFFEQAPIRRQFEFPAFEIGGNSGASYWYRRGVVEWQLFATKTKDTRDVARAQAFSIQARIERSIAKATTAPLVDDFGETSVFPARPFWSLSREGGGPKGSFIWRGRVGYQAVSVRDY